MLEFIEEPQLDVRADKLHWGLAIVMIFGVLTLLSWPLAIYGAGHLLGRW